MKLMSLLKEELGQTLSDNQVLALIDKTENLNVKHQIAAKHFKLISDMGGSRVVYGMNQHNNLVLKMARDSYEGQHNNKLEQKVFNCSGTASTYLTKLYMISQDGSYVIMEKVQTGLSEDDLDAKFEEMAGIPKGSLEGSTSWVLQALIENGDKEVGDYGTAYNYLLKSPWVKGLVDLLKTCHITTDDLFDKNWGIRPSTGQLVILDYGYEVF